MTLSPSGGGFHIWDAANRDDEAAWFKLWSMCPSREVSAHPAYVRLFTDEGDRALCASFANDDGATVLFPFILRSLSPIDSGAVVTDIVTPYGYGGPLTWGATKDVDLATRFWSAFNDWAYEHGVVTEFIRFGLFDEDFVDYPGDRIERFDNIVVDLRVGEEELLKSFEHKVRKNVKKAERSGVTISVDETGSTLDDFLRIYVGTMERREASGSYYFPREFFETINRELVGNFVYLNAHIDGRIISTELVLVSANSIYSFLGGTDGSAFEYRPNDLLKLEIMRWGIANDKTHFVLGGGASPGDGIEKYKKAFAPQGVMRFHTGQRILDQARYTQLVERHRAEVMKAGREWPESSSYFPEYRMPYE